MKDFLQDGKASVLLDGQFGSTGKGLAAAYVYEQLEKDVDWGNVVCTTNAAPNAGHTTVTKDGYKFVTFHMPTMGVLAKESKIVLNAGAIIDIDVLIDEVNNLGVDPNRVYIHQNAAVITQDDKEVEKVKSSSQTKIASTQKGVGAALSAKVARSGHVAHSYGWKLRNHGFKIIDRDLNFWAEDNYAIMVETPQGMGLSLNNGFYPYCTSREVSVSQSLSDAGLHPRMLHRTLMTMRTFPIRVGNIVDDEGKLVGWSGPVYDDQEELSWDDFPGVEPERTTVTKRVRRIFSFSQKQYYESLLRLQPDYVHVGFCDYLRDKDTFKEFVKTITTIEDVAGIGAHKVYSFGPSTNDVLTYEDALNWYK
jgi:adenylosuccinate synthase